MTPGAGARTSGSSPLAARSSVSASAAAFASERYTSTGAPGRPIVPYFLPIVVREGAEARYLGEDFAFSERLRRCGVPIVADTTIRLQHIGVYGYGWEDVGGALPRYSSYTLTFRRPGEGEGG